MDLNLSGKRALVTGSTAGIGEAIARSPLKAHRLSSMAGTNGVAINLLPNCSHAGAALRLSKRISIGQAA